MWNIPTDDFLIGEQRQWPRVRAHVKALYADQSGLFGEESLENISKGGCFIKSNRVREKGERMELILTLPGHAEEIAVEGQVMHVAEINPSIKGMGIMFTAIEPTLKTSLGRFLDELMEGPGGGARSSPRVETPQNRIVLTASTGDQSAILCNISKSGMYVRTCNALNLFDRISTTLTHPDNYLQFDIDGEVAHIHKVSDKPLVYGAGIRFMNLEAETQEAIIDLMREIMFRQRMNRPAPAL